MLKCRILINIIPARQQKDRERESGRERAIVTAAAAAIAAQMLNKVAQKVS